MQFERLVAGILHRMFGLDADELDEAIRASVVEAGTVLGADRCYVVTLHEDSVAPRIDFMWSAPGIAPEPDISSIIAELEFPWLKTMMGRDDDIVVRTLDDMPEAAARVERKYCVTRGIRSFLMCPMISRDTTVGMFGVDAVGAPRHWEQEDIRRLRIVGELIGTAMLRVRKDRQIDALQQRLEMENRALRARAATANPGAAIVGHSAPMRTVLDAVAQVAPTRASVLILGETGTGKELVARALHGLSPRSEQPLVTVNCAALAPTLIESELFGREKGAYTGAMTRHAGRFEMADGSTLFLDEIGELPVDLQVKLLRVLQTGTFERVGGNRTLEVDVRVVAATNRDLREAVRAGSFREDLYFRLNVFPIQMPPLRERPDDIPALVWAFVRELEGHMGRSVEQIPEACMQRLCAYHWPGNVRELRNAIERALIVCQGTTLEIAPPEPLNDGPPQVRDDLTLEELERDHVRATLERCGWRVRGARGAAERLGLKPTTLESRMKRLGIHRHA